MAKSGINVGSILGIGLLGFGGYYLLRRDQNTGTSLVGQLMGVDWGIGGNGSGGGGGGVATAMPSGGAVTPQPAATAQHRVYSTQQGDTLAGIAEVQFGAASLWPILHEYNRDLIGANPDIRSRAGLTLRLPTQEYMRQMLRYIFPSAAGGQSATRVAQQRADYATAHGELYGARATTYTVAPGDTLSGIAARFGVSGWQAIYEKNRQVIGANPNVIIPGQVLEVPVG